MFSFVLTESNIVKNGLAPSFAYGELLNNPNYRKFLHQIFPRIHVGKRHDFMVPLIDAAKNCSSAFVEFRSGCDPWTSNSWVRPLISRNMERLKLKLENLIHSILKYARPEVSDMMIPEAVDFEWSNYYFDNRRQFIGSYGIVLAGFLDFDLNVNVRVNFSTNRSGKIPIMGSDIKIELSFEEICDGQVLRSLFSAYTLQKEGRFTLNLFFDKNQKSEALPPNFDPDNVFPGDRLCETLKTKVYQAFPLRFPPGSLDSPASPADSDKTFSFPTSTAKWLESGVSISVWVRLSCLNPM